MTWWLLVVVGIAAALGSQLRFAVDQAIQRRTGGVVLPIGTMTVNAAGSLVLGVITGMALSGNAGPAVTSVVGTGLCGGLTTFSTWSYETLRLLEDGAFQEATVNIGLSLLIGLALGGLGLLAGTHL